ncbi:MAG: AAA family ATPase [Nitrospirae bacterium]|nr:AAA family ATPase [Nitrospirota bacterium]
MYKDYWGFKFYPFENVVDPKLFFRSSVHQEALIRIMYAIKNNKGIGVLSGEVGSGKTTIISYVCALIARYGYQIINFEAPLFRRWEFYKEVVNQFGAAVPVAAGGNVSQVAIIEQLRDILLRQVRNGAGSVVFIDEIQLVEDEGVFEEIRLLSNLVSNGRNLVTQILVGQPQVLKKLESMPNFQQRVAINYHLTPLSHGETLRYVLHRIEKAGGKEEILDKPCYDLIFQYSQGLPRVINTLCDLSLLVAAGVKAKSVAPEVVDKIAFDQGFRK